MAKIPDWQAKYIQNRQNGQTIPGPSHVRPDFSSPPNGPGPRSGDGDITDMLHTRIAQKAAQQSGGGTPADLVEGLKYYTRVQSGAFGNTLALFKTAGTIAGPTSRGVYVKNEVAGYLIDNLQTVDVAKIQENNEKMILVEVQVPFLGTFLVEKEAIVGRSFGGGAGRTILKG